MQNFKHKTDVLYTLSFVYDDEFKISYKRLKTRSRIRRKPRSDFSLITIPILNGIF